MAEIIFKGCLKMRLTNERRNGKVKAKESGGRSGEGSAANSFDGES